MVGHYTHYVNMVTRINILIVCNKKYLCTNDIEDNVILHDMSACLFFARHSERQTINIQTNNNTLRSLFIHYTRGQGTN